MARGGTRGVLLLALLFFHMTEARELDKYTWDDAVAGRMVFIKFFVPESPQCKSIQDSWQRLMDVYKNSITLQVAEVDCTGDGKSKCDELGVHKYPDIKYGDPDEMHTYDGSWSFDHLLEFAESLDRQCTPTNFGVCDEEQQEMISEFSALSPEDRGELILHREKQIRQAEKDFIAFSRNLSKAYHEQREVLNKTNETEDLANSTDGKQFMLDLYKQYEDEVNRVDQVIKDLKGSDYRLMKAVHFYRRLRDEL